MKCGRDHPSDDECERGHDLKINERFNTDTAEAFKVAHASNASYDRGEDDGCNHHPDQLNKRVTERLKTGRVETERGAEQLKSQGFVFGDGIADEHSERHADQDPEIELRIKRLSIHARRLSAECKPDMRSATRKNEKRKQ